MERKPPSVVFFDIGDTLGTVTLNPTGDRIEEIKVFPQVPDALRQLRERGASLGIISNRGTIPKANVNQALKRAGLFAFFTPALIFYGPKDSTGIFLRAVEKAGHKNDPRKCLFVGENESERQIASVAGLLVDKSAESVIKTSATNLTMNLEADAAMSIKKMKKQFRSALSVRTETETLRPLSKGEVLRRANHRFNDIFKKGKTKIRILIVADGDISFTTDDFGLSELVDKALKPSAMPWEKLKIVKAHRSAKAKGADVVNFKFDEEPSCAPSKPYKLLDHYDQIWLFGIKREGNGALSKSELSEIARFMNGGGGVFATGDHEDLGAALCGEVPRVRSMRRWFKKNSPPPVEGPERLDTLREGRDQGFRKDDQSDRFPQEIRPLFRTVKAENKSVPHELLTNGSLAITVLPDHFHEGECVIPKNLKAKIRLDDGTRFMEYPPERDKEERLSPEVVAIATSAAGYVAGELEVLPPVIPRCFNVIVAYDGHRADKVNAESEKEGVGRVVVDASFHHFVNINLKGEDKGDPHKRGLYDSNGNPTGDYLAIKQYYSNIKVWLCPPEKRACYYLNMLLAVRYLSPLIEEIRSIANPRLEDLMFAGEVTHRAIAERFSPTDATQCALFAAGTVSPKLKTGLGKLFDAWTCPSLQVELPFVFFNIGLIPRLILGIAMISIASCLPESSSDVKGVLAEGEARQEQLESVISTGLQQGATLVNSVIEQCQATCGGFAELLTAHLGTGSNHAL